MSSFMRCLYVELQTKDYLESEVYIIQEIKHLLFLQIKFVSVFVLFFLFFMF